MEAPTPGFMIGVGLAGVGVVGVFGSITGNLPAMIAALFYPSLLGSTSDAVNAQKKVNAKTATTGVKSPFTTKPATSGESWITKLLHGQLPGQFGN